MKKKFSSVLTVAMAAILSLSLIAMVGCTSPAPAADSGAAESGAAESGAAVAAPAGAAIDQIWQGSWYSTSEIVPPEEQTDAYDIVIAEDGSFVLSEDGKELYAGTIEVTNQPEDGWADVMVDGATIKAQLVNAQGIYKFIFNAGDDWDKSLKKIIFQR